MCGGRERERERERESVSVGNDREERRTRKERTLHVLHKMQGNTERMGSDGYVGTSSVPR